MADRQDPGAQQPEHGWPRPQAEARPGAAATHALDDDRSAPAARAPRNVRPTLRAAPRRGQPAPATRRRDPAAAPPRAVASPDPQSRRRRRASRRSGQPPRSPEPSAAAEPAAAADALPLADYDDLSVASLRARLRTSTPPAPALLDYEKATPSRADVITMFERRIAKITAA